MRKLLFFGSVLLVLLNSCGSSKKVAKVERNRESSIIKSGDKSDVSKHKIGKSFTKNDAKASAYIAAYGEIARKEMKIYGVPASITLAQGLLESNYGGSRLAKEANNHFGIKCHDWTGKTIKHDDNKLQECFRKYDTAEESFKDHSKFLADRGRYSFLFRLPKTDYEAWAKGLKKAGYATDPSYPDKLIYIIEKYKLYQYDTDVLKGMRVKVDENTAHSGNSGGKFIYEVEKGETLYAISKKFNVLIKDIMKYNNLQDFDIYEGQLLVLTKGDESTETSEAIEAQQNPQETEYIDADTNETYINHVVEQGETLYSLAKKYNTDINTIIKTNNIVSGEVNINDKLKIYKNKFTQVEPVNDVVETVSNSNADAIISLNHTVQAGETLYSIAKKYNTDIPTIISENQITGSQIKINQVLKISKNKKFDIAKAAVEEVNTTTEVVNETYSVPEYHIVKSGETLFAISRKYGVDVPTLKRINHLSSNNIRINQRLKILDNQSGSYVEEYTENPEYHVVKKGESLYRIGLKYNITVDRLKELNNLQNNAINVGQRLRVK